MGNVVSAVNIRLGLTSDRFKAELDRAAARMDKFKKENFALTEQFRAADRINREYARGVGRLDADLQKLGRTMVLAVSLPIALLGKNALESYARIERLEIGIQAIEQSAIQSTLALGDLRAIAKLPGLGITEANKFYLSLRNVKFSAEQATRTIKALGNAVALSGGGREQLDSLALQVPQLLAKGKVTQEDIKPIINASPVLSSLIQDLYGTLDTSEIQSQLEKAGKSSRDFVAELVQQAEKLAQVDAGWANALENISDSGLLLSAEFGRAAVNGLGLTGTLDGLSDGMDGFATVLREASPATQGLITGLVGITAAVPVVILGIGTLQTVLGTPWKAGLAAATRAWQAFTVSLATGIAGPLVYAGAILALTYAVVKYSAATDTAIDKRKLLAEVETNASKATSEQIFKLEQLVKTAGNVAVSDKEREKAAKRVAEITGLTTKEINKETIANGQAAKAIDAYIERLKLLAKAKTAAQLSADKGLELDKINQTDAKEFLSFGDKVVAGLQSVAFTKGLYGYDKLLEARANELKDSAKAVATKEKAFYDKTLDEIKAEGGFTFDEIFSFGDFEDGKKGLDGVNKELAKLIKNRKALSESTANEADKLEIENIENKKDRLLKLAQYEYEQAVATKEAEYEKLKKPLDAAYFRYKLELAKKLSREIVDIEKEAFSDLFKGINELDNDKKLKPVKEYTKNLEKDVKDALPKQKRPPLGADFFRLDPNSLSENNKILEANKKELLEFLSDFGADMGAGLANITGEIIQGTATIRDAADFLLSSLGDLLSQLSRGLFKQGLVNLGLGNPLGIAQIFGGIISGIGGGAAKGKVRQRQQEVKLTTNSRLKGQDIYNSGQGYVRLGGY